MNQYCALNKKTEMITYGLLKESDSYISKKTSRYSYKTSNIL